VGGIADQNSSGGDKNIPPGDVFKKSSEGDDEIISDGNHNFQK